MDDGVEVWRGSVATWECDAMGHLNVRFYVAKAMEALAGLAAELGMPRAFAPEGLSTLVVREQHIRFIREARAGAPLVMTGGVVEIGESDARLLLVLRHLDGAVAAAFQTVVAHVTTGELRPFPWPPRLRERALALRMAVPAEIAPRSIGVEPVESRASLQAAVALGLRRLALGVVQAEDCDVHGRMRPEMLMARISDGMPHLMAARRRLAAKAGKPVGGAALEYRLIHLDWPRAGQRVDLRSGASGGDAQFRRLTHWLLDPDSGRPWGVAESIAVSFDLETRRMITLEGDALAAARAEETPGLTL